MLAYDDIQAAAVVLRDHIVRTPLLESELLNQQLKGRVLFKAENLQRTGSFKIRGATNKILSLDEKQRSSGVVAYSSGNHAQGVAAAAARMNIPATIVIPKDAPALKIANTRAYGAQLELYDRYQQNREQITEDIAECEGRAIVKPYDDEKIIAGQGTVGLEIVEQLAEKAIVVDTVLCPCGGGGLIAGLSTAIKAHLPDSQIYAVEPQYFDDTKRSLLSGKRETNQAEARSICDAIVTPTPGEITFEINSRLLSGGYAVSEDAVKQAIVTAYNYLKLVVEPGAAVGLAAILSGEYQLEGKTTVVVLSGGNMDIETLMDYRMVTNSSLLVG
ncbi:MAG: threonine/serine dehydratase [Gammaproteobacteria bacterium]|nr:threonine/serine dehydratase [Gammaproteobacteria bacterium]